MKTPRLLLTACCLALLLDPAPAPAFCGFYVAKADTKLFNKASKVVLVRDGDRTVLTMANDYQGEPKDFAVVIPVPTFIQKDQIHVTEMKIVDHLDAYSAPRLVEYFDEDPCRPVPVMRSLAMSAAPAAKAMDGRAQSLGVKIEATYTVGEYDIMILSSEQSGGLITFLKEEGYKLPAGADEVVGSYLKQNMRFFVAKVNMEEKAKLGTTYLRPLQVAYESPKFMLPIRLGTVNADGPQELFIFVLAKDGRVETTNYRTVKLPSDLEVPVYIKNEFGPFYRALFDTAVKKEDMRAVFLEYAWDMGWCDPCAADPLTNDELRELGVFWLEGDQKPRSPWGGGGQPVYVTRLHVRYDRDHFPDDLVFQQTSDRQNFQGRYILRHPWKGVAECEAGRKYFEALPAKLDQQAQNCARLTGWDIAEIRRKMGVDSFVPPTSSSGSNWWNKIWK
jgi:hypothetical protein